MKPEVVEMEAKRPHHVPDLWFAQVDLRLSKIEDMVARLERQVWTFVYAAGALVVIEVFRALIGA